MGEGKYMKFKFKREIVRNIQSKINALEQQRQTADNSELFKIELSIAKLNLDLEQL